ncbi:MAG: surface lipoprotein assembly modifier [Alphaproteobacteria bacterium]|nr:surface lipoprotein assembly modifier [Alphaproteobacteria bacterium]
MESAATEIARARALMNKRRYFEALKVLRPLAGQRPVPADALFLIGVAGIEASQLRGVSEQVRDTLLDAAIQALRSMLVQNPALVRVRLELARAFFLKGEDGLARRPFEQVLAGQPPPPVALNVNRFLAQIRARKRWSIRVGAALAPDSNISSNTDEETIVLDTPFGRLPFTVQDNERKSGVGLAFWAGGEYQYPLDERWRLRSGADFSRREYRSSEFDRMFAAGHLGPRWLIGPASEASVLASVRQSWLSDKAEYRGLGLRAEGRRRLNRRITANLNAARHERRYEVSTHLDGPVTDISAGVGWAASTTMRVDAAVGWGRERTEHERYRHSRRWLRAGTTVALPWGFTVGGSATLRRSDYPADWAPYVLGGGPRRDLTRTLQFNVHHRAVTVGGFSPQLSVVQEERKSNAQLYDYDRISGELRFVRLF